MSVHESTTAPESIKSKISFSVESLLSGKEDRSVVEEDIVEDIVEEESEEEHIEVDDVDSRESSSPGAAQLVVPQPLHPSAPRGLFAPPQWPFSWIGPAGPMYRSASPQCMYY